MSDLTTVDKQILEKLFQMWAGYVLDFSNRTMLDFFSNDVGINIYDDKYSDFGDSKANRIRSFWTLTDNKTVGKSILKLIEYIENKILIDELKGSEFLDIKMNAWKAIWNKLINSQNETIVIDQDANLSEFILEYIKKTDDEIKKADYAWSIWTISTFLEEFFDELHIKLTWKSIWKNADLRKDYVEIKKLLNLAEDWDADEKIKQILSSFSNIINAIDLLCNRLGDRHRKLKDEDGIIRYKPLKHHAVLMLNSAKTLSQFLYDVYEYQPTRKNILEKELLNILKIKF